MAYLLYCITNKVTGKVYIGQTTQSIARRKAEHTNRCKAGKRDHKLYLSMRKHGIENFVFEVIARVASQEVLDKLEIEFIHQYNSYNRGYNSTEGGDSVSQETRKKLSEIFKGRKVTWSHKILEARRRNGTLYGVQRPKYGADNQKSKTYLVRTPSGDDVKFTGLRQYCRENSLSHNLLLSTLKGIQSHHKGYVLLETFND